MSFRRQRDAGDDFLGQYGPELRACGIPDYVVAKKTRFLVFLDHGVNSIGEEIPAICLNALRPVVQALPRCDKFLLVQERIAELAQEEGLTTIEYPVWSPYDAHSAAATLLQLLEQEKATDP